MAVGCGRPPDRFRASRHGRRTGLEETDALRTPSNLCWRRMSPASSTRIVLMTRPWCSTRSGAEAIPGLAASRCRSGWSGARAATSTPRVRCGRSFVSIGFRGSSKAARPTGAQIPSPSYLFNNGDSADGRSSAPSNLEGQADELKATEPHQLMPVNQVFVVRICRCDKHSQRHGIDTALTVLCGEMVKHIDMGPCMFAQGYFVRRGCSGS